MFSVDPCILQHRLSSVPMTAHQRTDRACSTKATWYFFGAGSENIQTRCTARIQKTPMQTETQAAEKYQSQHSSKLRSFAKLARGPCFRALMYQWPDYNLMSSQTNASLKASCTSGWSIHLSSSLVEVAFELERGT